MFDGEVVVFQIFAVLLGVLGDVVELSGHAWLVAAERLGEFVDRCQGSVAHHARRLAQLGEHRSHDRVVLGRQGHQQVIRRELRIRAGLRLINGCGKGFLRFDGPGLGVDRHVASL